MGGINFDQGLSISGTWENRRTGEVVSVKDCVMEDNQIVIIGNNGRMYKYEQFQEFVQISGEVQPYKPPTKTVVGKNVNKLTHGMDIPKSSVMDIPNMYVEDELYMPIDTPIYNTPVSSPISVALKNLPDEEKPVVITSIKWDDMSIVDFLNKYMGASYEQISDEVVNEFCDLNTIKEELALQIKKMIDPINSKDTDPPTKPKRVGRPKKSMDDVE